MNLSEVELKQMIIKAMPYLPPELRAGITDLAETGLEAIKLDRISHRDFLDPVRLRQAIDAVPARNLHWLRSMVQASAVLTTVREPEEVIVTIEH